MQEEAEWDSYANVPPSANLDGTTESTVVQPAYRVGSYLFVELAVPSHVVPRFPFGSFVMARCSYDEELSPRTDWSIYLRRPLFITQARADPAPRGLPPDITLLRFLLPDTPDAGYRVLRNLKTGARVNLLGPFGRESTLADSARQLLLVAAAEAAPLLLPAAERMLDRGGRVTLIVRDAAVDKGLLSLLPLSVEIQAAADRDQWLELVAGAIAWSDALIICDDMLSPQAWADEVRRRRFILDEYYAQILVPAAFLCGFGACTACVVQRTDGSLTRACVHGPVFPLADLIL